MSVLNTGLATPATGFTLDQSLRFNDDDSAYLSTTLGTATHNDRATFSCWTKRGNLVTDEKLISRYTDTNNRFYIGIQNQYLLIYSKLSSSTVIHLNSTAVFRDTSAWYHILVAMDTGQVTAANRIKVYVNGSQITDFSTETYPTQNQDLVIQSATSTPLTIGAYDPTSTAQFYDGYLAEVHFIDGTQLTPSSFGETGDYGEWKPKEVSGLTYGTNGFYLPFKQDYTVEGFSAVTWKGNGVDNTYIGGVGFQPDLVWLKAKDTNQGNHYLIDAVRGENNSVHRRLVVNGTQAEADGYSDNFSSDGFRVGTNQTVNSSSYTYVAWCWDMGGSNASNTNGSITSTVRANPTYGQSIVSYTGNATNAATIGHGLSSAPDMVIVKNRDRAAGWHVGGAEIGNGSTQYLNLHTTAALDNATTGFQAFTSTTFQIGNDTDWNASGEDIIAYCFHSVAGYSKIGTYTGTAGTHTVTTGFQPAFVLIKRTDTSGNSWAIFDSTRDPDGAADHYLYADDAAAEGSGTTRLDFISTGFTLQNSAQAWNGSGSTYIYMAFADKREYAYWLDQSGNNNDWTSNNLTESDISVDSPTNNFATLNPLHKTGGTYSEGNLKVVSESSTYKQYYGNMGISSGKWYWECNMIDVGSVATNTQIGISGDHGQQMDANGTSDGNAGITGGDAASYAYGSDGKMHNNEGAGAGAAYGTAYVNGDIVGVMVDLDNGKIWYSKNGTVQNSGNPVTGADAAHTNLLTNALYTTSMSYFPAIHLKHDGDTGTWIFNFGQDSSFAGNKTAQGNQDGNSIGDFYYAPPTGFLALCTSNLPDVAVVPSEHFNTVLWTGTTSVDRDITGIGFDPSLVWIKSRSDAYEQLWFDKVRGAGERLMSHNNNAESTNDSTLNAFITDGFTLGNGSTVDLSVNGNTSKTYVAWNWNCPTTFTPTVTSGLTSASGRSNADAGFSIVKVTADASIDNDSSYTHNLGAVPEMIITKITNSTGGWNTYHKDLGGAGKYIELNTTTAVQDATNVFETTPTSTIVKPCSNIIANGQTLVFYNFASVDGYSKVGSYTGNGNADGTFVYLGFRPAWIMYTTIDGTANHWVIRDNKRDPYNEALVSLYANLNIADDTGGDAIAIDMVSNGFKARRTNSQVNESGTTYIYIAFAETPFKYSNAR